MSSQEARHTWCYIRARSWFLCALLVAVLGAVVAMADGPIASSSFTGVESPLSENGAWVSIMAYSPYGTLFQKNNGAFADRLSPLNHAGVRTTATLPADQYSEIVVGHIADAKNNVGPLVRVQTAGATTDSTYLWWASVPTGVSYLYRLDANVPDPSRGTSYTAVTLIPTSPAADGDRLRLIARGTILYGLKNGVRDFIYNTGRDALTYTTGSTGILAYADGAVNNAVIASWSTGPAPASAGTWDSSNFVGTENPLDDGDRWYPLPGYDGFRKASGAVVGIDSGHNASGVWSITPPATQYSQVTLGSVTSGGGGPIVRIDRNNPGQTGWLLFLYADYPPASGIYKMTPDGNFSAVQLFTPTLVSGDKWSLSANANTLQVFQNGISQLTYATDGSYATGDVGIEAYTPAFTFSAWEGGDPAGSGTLPAPTITGYTPGSGPYGSNVTITGTNLNGATQVLFNGASASFTVTSSSAIQATVPTAATSGLVSVITLAGKVTSSSAFTVLNPPTITSFSPSSGTVGSGVTISGTNFTGATAVTFNNASATFTVTSATTIQAIVPTGATSGTLSVSTPAGTATSSSAFTVINPPTIGSFSPTSGTVGTSVTISGTNFTGATAVTFNNASATFTVTSATTIQTTVPSAATTGPLSVVTPGGTATTTSSFTVQMAPPSQVNLTVSKSGTGSGIVTSTSSPANATQISCGTTCVVAYNSGTVVTLTATAAGGSSFTSWSGCDTSSATACTVTMTAARSVIATFTQNVTQGGPIASSSFTGVESPLSENGAWVSIMAYSPYGTLFQKNNGAFADRLSPLNHAGVRTTATLPADQYSEIVVGHIADAKNNVGPLVRVQTAGATTDSTYLWWASVPTGVSYLYRLDANVPDPSRGTSYTAVTLIPTSPAADGDRLRLIARGTILYGLKNGVRDFIYNTGRDALTYTTGSTGILAYADGAVNNAVIASWSTGPAPASAGTWDSSNFVGTENPLDDGDRWYPLPGYDGFRKASGAVVGIDSGHNASGVWSITPPATQYSQVTLGSVTSGGGGPIVRIDRNNPGQTGWLLFLYADYPPASGIYKMTPDGNFSAVQLFTPTLVSGDKWSLSANANTLQVFRNGVFQYQYTTDGSYAAGDVGIEAYTPAFTFSGWEGGDTAGASLPVIKP